MQVGDDLFSPLSIRASPHHSCSSTVGIQSTIDSDACEASEKEQSVKRFRSSLSICQHDRKEREPLRIRRQRCDTNSLSFSSPDSDYRLGLS